MLHSNSAHNLFKVCSNTTCIYFQLILHIDPYTSMKFSGKQLHGSQETYPWHLIPAPRNHILEKGNQINPSYKVFKKNKIEICLEFKALQDSTKPDAFWDEPKMGKNLTWPN